MGAVQPCNNRAPRMGSRAMSFITTSQTTRLRVVRYLSPTELLVVTIVLRCALCLPLFGALSRTLSCSLSLSFPLTLSTALDPFYDYHMYTIFSRVTYLLSHAYDIHMLTNFTCLSLSHVYCFISSIKYPL